MDAEKTEESRKNSVPAIVVTKDSSDQAGPEKPRVVRKTSIRRRVSKDEKRPLETYGNMHEEYDKIIERMMADKGVQNTIEALTERWRMIMFMFEDCVETVKTRNENKALGEEDKTTPRINSYIDNLLFNIISGLRYIYNFVYHYILKSKLLINDW